MTAARRCPDCGAELPANSPENLCPKCLLQAGLASQGSSQPELERTAATPPASGFIPPPPEELARRFPQLEVLELLGKGGMGAVYKAKQQGLDRMVALKILPPEVAGDPAFAERFTREARALAKLNHPSIVGVYDFGQTEGLYYFIMEYVDGTNLRQIIQAHTLTPKDALAIVPQICDALQYAHDEGVVHRDIKPENILLDKKGRAKIADFGLVKLLGQEQAEAHLTGTHQVMGTLRYMAPEQMEGSRQVDHRADIYSLGVVFYELLTGELPLGRFAPPSKKVQIDVRLDEVVLRALEKEPEQRYQHASDVKTEIEAIRAGASSTSTASPSSLVVPDFVVRRRLALFCVFFMTLANVCFGVLDWGYLSGADWYFKKELPHQYLSTGLQLFFAMGLFFGTYWWYLLAKEPQTPRSLQDFWSKLQTPDRRHLRLWLPLGVYLFAWFVAIALLMTTHASDKVQTLVLSGGIMFLPYYVMCVLWSEYRPKVTNVSEAGVSAPKAKKYEQIALKEIPVTAKLAVVCLGVALLTPTFLFMLGGSIYAVSQTLRIGLALAMLLGLLSIRHPLGRYSMLAAVLVLGCFSAVQIYMHKPVVPIVYPHFGDTGFVQGPDGPMLGAALQAKLGIPPGQAREANAIFQKYYKEYLALERRHTKYTRDDNGHVYITIEPFVDEMYVLAQRLQAELGGVVDQRIAPPPPEKGKVHVNIGLFRHAGEATVSAELWKDAHGLQGHTYFMKESIQWADGSSAGGRGYSGWSSAAFPDEYRLYWTEPGQ